MPWQYGFFCPLGNRATARGAYVLHHHRGIALVGKGEGVGYIPPRLLDIAEIEFGVVKHWLSLLGKRNQPGEE